MDFATLCGMDKVNFREVLLKSASSKEQKNIQKTIEEWESISGLLETKIKNEEKRTFLLKNKKIVENK